MDEHTERRELRSVDFEIDLGLQGKVEDLYLVKPDAALRTGDARAVEAEMRKRVNTLLYCAAAAWHRIGEASKEIPREAGEARVNYSVENLHRCLDEAHQLYLERHTI